MALELEVVETAEEVMALVAKQAVVLEGKVQEHKVEEHKVEEHKVEPQSDSSTNANDGDGGAR